MPGNTYRLVSILAVIAAFLIGFNIGRSTGRVVRETGNVPQKTTVTAAVTPTPSPIPDLTFDDTACRFTFDYPAVFSVEKDSSGSGSVTNKAGNTVLLFACSKDIPRPALPKDKTETVKVASIAATLYHETSPKDGSPLDIVIFRHPKTGSDIYIAGVDEGLRHTYSTVTVY